MFGDGVYEVIPVYSGKLLRGKGHLQRLQHSLDAIGIPSPLTSAEWLEIFASLIEQNIPGADGVIYLQITRGTMVKRDHAWSSDLQPNVLVTCTEQVYILQESATAGKKQSRSKIRAGAIAISKPPICYRIRYCTRKLKSRARSRRSCFEMDTRLKVRRVTSISSRTILLLRHRGVVTCSAALRVKSCLSYAGRTRLSVGKKKSAKMNCITPMKSG